MIRHDSMTAKHRRIDEWCASARQLDGLRGEEEFYAGSGKAEVPCKRRRTAGKHGVNYFSCASMGLKPPTQRCTGDVCE